MKFLLLIIPMLILATGALAQEVDLMVGQNMVVGSVNIWNDQSNIYVSYNVEDGWCLTETHLEVASSLEEIPKTNSGAPKVGNFEYSSSHDCVAEYVYEIPEQSVGSCPIIAAHAVVKNKKEETAWAKGESFEKGWGMYFQYAKNWNLPENVDMHMGSGFGNGYHHTYFDIILSNIVQGYSIFDGPWPGWCVDTEIYIYDIPYYARILSSLDPNLESKCPYCVDDEDWNRINYILNNKDPQASWSDIQAAIWAFADESPNYQGYLSEKAQQMIDDAQANGGDFYPSCGQYGAVILDNGPNVQLVFIELDP